MGPRWPSSPAEYFCAEYIKEKMSKIVDEVDSETFEYPLYVPIEAGLEIISDTKKEFPAIGVQYSANGECEGDLIYVENGDTFNPDVSSVIIKDRILLARTRRPYLLASATEGSGVKAIVVIAESPRYTLRALTAKVGYTKEWIRRFTVLLSRSLL